jgi:hypothetical protein
MIEVAVIFDKEGKPLYWSTGRGASIEDSRSFWDVIWENRDKIQGIAHTHPWVGPTQPSGTDITTWEAIEKGLGIGLLWPIITMSHEHYFMLNICTGKVVEANLDLSMMKKFVECEDWKNCIDKLRELSRGVDHG